MTVTEQFAEALTALETTRDLEPFLAQFSDAAELARPEAGGREQGADGARRYWQAYLDQFQHVRSEFSRVEESGHLGELEWVSTGMLASGRDISYAGVSLLAVEDGRVRRFVSYYDTAAFLIKPT